MFDEIDKMPVGVMDGIKPYLDYIEKVDHVDFRFAVINKTFLLMANAIRMSLQARYFHLLEQYWWQRNYESDLTSLASRPKKPRRFDDTRF